MVCSVAKFVMFLVETVNWHLPSYIATACIIYAMNLTVDPDQSDLTQSTIRLFQEILHLESVCLAVLSRSN